MQIVIELPEDKFKAIIEKYDTFPKEMKEWGLDAIKNGTPLSKAKEYGFIAVCDSEYPLTEKVKQDIKDTIFVGNEECSYCFEILEIISAERSDNG